MKTTKDKNNMRNIPILNIRIMSDDEWNKLAYRNYLERQVKSNGQTTQIY